MHVNDRFIIEFMTWTRFLFQIGIERDWFQMIFSLNIIHYFLRFDSLQAFDSFGHLKWIFFFSNFSKSTDWCYSLQLRYHISVFVNYLFWFMKWSWFENHMRECGMCVCVRLLFSCLVALKEIISCGVHTERLSHV